MQTDMKDQISHEQMLRVFYIKEIPVAKMLDIVNEDSWYKAD